MKKILILLGIILFSSSAFSQIGQFYGWTDSLVIGTSSTDSTFATAWESVSIWSDSVDFFIKLGMPDTTGWDDRRSLHLTAGSPISIGPANRLTRMEWWSTTSGTLYMVGIKKVRQH